MRQRSIRKLRKLSIVGECAGFLSALLLFLPAIAHAAGGKPATKVYNVADTRAMSSGISKLIADLYNGNSVIFGLVVVGVMAGLGLILGYAMDLLIKRVGIDLSRLEHHE
ncbi:MAG: hypothetical protein HY770_00940 [Chitinivibrionia bacterium]|nr:hypothetical protein [Chitinivibrionia bacterium]